MMQPHSLAMSKCWCSSCGVSSSYNWGWNTQISHVLSIPSKYCNLDPIPTWILKDHIDILLPAITKIVNLSIKSSVFPSNFKSAVVKPLLKKPSLDPENLKNYYRPVSNLTFVSKSIEKVVAASLNEHLQILNECLPIEDFMAPRQRSSKSKMTFYDKWTTNSKCF